MVLIVELILLRLILLILEIILVGLIQLQPEVVMILQIQNRRQLLIILAILLPPVGLTLHRPDHILLEVAEDLILVPVDHHHAHIPHYCCANRLRGPRDSATLWHSEEVAGRTL